MGSFTRLWPASGSRKGGRPQHFSQRRDQGPAAPQGGEVTNATELARKSEAVFIHGRRRGAARKEATIEKTQQQQHYSEWVQDVRGTGSRLGDRWTSVP